MSRRNKRRGLVSIHVTCPECGDERAITYNPHMKRFRARQYRCHNDECDFFGTRIAWKQE